MTPGSGPGAGSADVIAEYDGSDNLLCRYVHGPGADEPLVWYEGSGTSDRRFLMADARGSIIGVMDSSGNVTDKNTYDAYGNPASTNVGRFQYTGQMWLAEAQVYHYKARSYDPAIGRFLQTDPIGYGDGMNMYAYAGNDPVNGSDPTGLCTGSNLGGGGLCPGGNSYVLGSGYWFWGAGHRTVEDGGARLPSGRAHGTVTICDSGACEGESGFIPGDPSTAVDNGDQIVVTGHPNFHYTYWPQFNSLIIYASGSRSCPYGCASAGEQRRDYLGGGQADQGAPGVIQAEAGYSVIEFNVYPYGKNLSAGKIIPGVGPTIPKSGKPGVNLQIVDPRGRGTYVVNEIVQTNPGHPLTVRYEVHPTIGYTIRIQPVGSAPWSYDVYGYTYFPDI